MDKPIKQSEIPNIKFTLRLTDSLNKYLEWLNIHQKANKAEYIRNLIEQEMKSNSKYKVS